MTCKCSTALGNTGLPKGEKCFTKVQSIYFQQKYNDAGVRNVLDLTGLSAQDLADLFTTDSTPDVRLYPITNIEEFLDTQSEAVTETTASGRVLKIADGIRTVSFSALEVPPILLKKIAALGCGEWQYYIVDVDGNIAGGFLADATADTIAGFDFDSDSFNATYVRATDTTVQRINVTFNWFRWQKIEDFAWFPHEDLAEGFNPNDVKGLIDVTFEGVTADGGLQTDITNIKPVIQYSRVQAYPLTGLVAADFVLTNLTTGLPVVILTVTESLVTPGTYSLTFAAQTAADVMEVQVANDTYESSKLQHTLTA